ncbi:inner membrane protein YhjD [Hoyosella rhizosphaerae]|uniref:Inner membrane protein YhjD n=1 Tax=Hoyosella rhizosphaerae TaxID=1755582 RepID=A0A916UAN0_9ACTN|nr:inner membrane protein YhjD [Hoyosella rhizosphaerae]MBN4926101.1 inner membrane protein YhjD [Hoyosella rhizosphaerae]GGC65594.1 inner membrane protein YhjD [Hoyosella rhizosphaerae]
MADKPGFLDKQRAKHPWLDHLIRAATRFTEQHGDYYAAGITYFSVLALFPLLMVGFAGAGFVLAGNLELLEDVKAQVTESIPGGMGEQVNTLIDQAIEQRNTVGLIGIAVALYSGLGWIANLRKALSAQWDQPMPKVNFIKTKIVDLGAMITLFLALAVSLALSALGGSGLTTSLLGIVGLDEAPGVGILVRIVSLAVAIGATWLLFTWIIARMPRQPVAFGSAAQAGLIAAVVFEIFKQLGVAYLQGVTQSPAGAVFGPLIGILVFIFITSRFLLFATAWAATTTDSMERALVLPPKPVLINTPVVVREGNSLASGVVGFGAGALAVLGVSGLARRNKPPQK